MNEKQIRDVLTDGKLAVEMRQYSRAKTVLSALDPTKLPRSLKIDYLYYLGQAEGELRGSNLAREHLQEALALLEWDIQANPLKRVQIIYHIGFSYYLQHLFRQALDNFEICRDALLGDTISDQPFKLRVFSTVAMCQVAIKDYKHALQTYREALKLATVGEDDFYRASTYWGMAIAYLETGKLPSATTSWMRCIGIYERLGQKTYAAMAKGILSEILADRKMFDQSLKTIDEALNLTPSNDLVTLSLLHLNQAYTYMHMDAHEQALESNEKSLAYSRQINNWLNVGQALTQFGRIYGAMGKGEKAIAYFKEAIEVLKRTEEKIALSKSYRFYAEVARGLGKFDEAYEAMEAAYVFEQGLELV